MKKVIVGLTMVLMILPLLGCKKTTTAPVYDYLKQVIDESERIPGD